MHSVAQPHAQTVRDGERDRVFGGEGFGPAQDDAVHHDERHENAELLVQRVGVGLHEQFHGNHERRGNGDEADDADFFGDDVAHQRDEHVGEHEYEDDRQPHAKAVVGGFGHGEGRAQPEHQPERGKLGPQALGEFLDELLHSFPLTARP